MEIPGCKKIVHYLVTKQNNFNFLMEYEKLLAEESEIKTNEVLIFKIRTT